jgi:hypothetical protein
MTFVSQPGEPLEPKALCFVVGPTVRLGRGLAL